MLQWLARQYAKRIVNINVNVTVAAIMAAALTMVVVHFSRYLGIKDDDKILIMAITYTADWVIDVVVALGLHWLANHWPSKWRQSQQLLQQADQALDNVPRPVLAMVQDAATLIAPGRERSDPGNDAKAAPPSKKLPHQDSFLRDATKLQLQRLCLSPLFYVIAAVGQHWMLDHGVAREFSVLLPFAVAILITRAIHTYWMLKSDPIVLAEWEASKRRREERNASRPATALPPLPLPAPHPAPPTDRPVNGQHKSPDAAVVRAAPPTGPSTPL